MTIPFEMPESQEHQEHTVIRKSAAVAEEAGGADGAGGALDTAVSAASSAAAAAELPASVASVAPTLASLAQVVAVAPQPPPAPLTDGAPVLWFGLPDAAPSPDAVLVDLDALIEAGVGLLVYGMTRSGKSHLVRGLLEQTHGRVLHVVIDSEGEFGTLREHFDYLLAAGGGRPGDLPLTPVTAPLLCRRVMELGVSVILDIYDLPEEERAQVVTAFLSEMLEIPDEHRRPVLVVIDEVHRFAPEGGQRPPSLRAIGEIGARGAKRGILPVLATQNIAKTSKRAIEEVGNKIVGRITLDTHADRAADDLGLRRSDVGRVKTLPRGHFYAYLPTLLGGVTLVQTAPNRTAAPPKFVQGARPAAPPTPTAIREMLAQFADLASDLARGEEADAADSSKTSASGPGRGRGASGARGAGTTAGGPPPAAPEVQVVYKPVAVVSDAQTERLGRLVESMLSVGTDMLSVGKDLVSVGGEIRAALSSARREASAGEGAEENAGESGGSATAADTLAGTLFTVPAIVPAVPSRASPRNSPRTRDRSSPGNTRRSGSSISSGGSGSASLPAPQQRILDALAQFAALGLSRVGRANVAVWADQSPRSSGFANNLSALRSAGLIDYPEQGSVSLTAAGRKAAVPADAPLNRAALRTAWIKKLSGPQGRILEALCAAYPRSLTRDALAGRVGQSVTSSGYANNLSTLRSLGLIDYPVRGSVAATSLLFPDGLS